MNGKQIAELLYEWATKKKIQNDNFNHLFVEELLEKLEDDDE
ncbi:hypothetical protein [Alkalihalobacillus deserti]|nr:hypothetical protein [Alkalihalobacillus deserti]